MVMLPSLPAQTCRAKSNSSSSSTSWQLSSQQQASCCRRVYRAVVVPRVYPHATEPAACTAAVSLRLKQQQTAGHCLISSRRAASEVRATDGSTSSSSSSSGSRNNTWCCRASAATAAAAGDDDVASAETAAATAAVSTSQSGPALSVGQTVEVRCERIGTGGVGVCLWGDSQLVLLVKGALPGEQLAATITAVKRSYAEGSKVRTLTEHHDAVPAACEHYGTCGGCSLQALSYPAQLAHKVGYVGQMLARVGRVPADDIAAAQQPAVAADAVFGYRNKLQMAFSSLMWQEAPGPAERLNTQHQQKQQLSVPVDSEKEGMQADEQSWQSLELHPALHPTGFRVQGGQVQQGFGLGYYLPGSNSIVVPIQRCWLVSDEMNNVVTQVRLLCQQHGLQPHNHPGGLGVLLHLVVRSAAAPATPVPQALSTPPPPNTSSRTHTALPSVTPSVVAAHAPAAAEAGFSSEAAGAVAAAVPTPSLMAVLVTTAAAQQQPHTLQTLSTIAQELLCTCPGLVSVVHSLEGPSGAEAAAAAAADGGGGGARSRVPSGRPHKKRPGGRGQKKSSSTSSSSNSNSSTRGARPLRVLSSQVLAGGNCLVESMCGLRFQLSPHSFFQTNTAQAEKLYNIVVQAVSAALHRDGPAPAAAMYRESPAPAAATSPPTAAVDAAAGVVEDTAPVADVLLQQVFGSASDMMRITAQEETSRCCGMVLDLYCGTGTIALCLAAALPQHHIIGLDVSSSSIIDAAANAELNCLTNVTFKCANLDELLSSSATQRSGPAGANQQHSRSSSSTGSSSTSVDFTANIQQQLPSVGPKVVVVDPARAGLGRAVVQYLLGCGADRVVYVSCNAATQARDLQALCGGGVFKVVSWVCVDLFPHTDVAHVETVVVLDRV